MQSMTGYAYGEELRPESGFSVEIKSYNGKYCDISVNLPPYLGRLENRFRAAAAEKIRRGRVEITFRVKHLEQKRDIAVNVALAKAYAESFRKLAEAIGLDARIPLGLLAAQEGVLTADDECDPEQYWELLSPLFFRTLGEFVAEREREGENLRADVLDKLAVLESSLAVFAAWQSRMDEAFRAQLAARFAEVMGDAADEQRILSETAAMLVKYTISEETVRLKSHIAALHGALAPGGADAPGRRIDFICQELNREINTVGSKNQCVEVGEAVIAAKDALENIREQARNLE
jgi:uncharacterized protein (TIGR00255 family)